VLFELIGDVLDRPGRDRAHARARVVHMHLTLGHPRRVLAREPEPLRSALRARFAEPPPYLGVPLEASAPGEWSARVLDLGARGAPWPLTLVYLGAADRAAALSNWRKCYAPLHVSCLSHVDEFAVFTGVVLVRGGAAQSNTVPPWLDDALTRVPRPMRTRITSVHLSREPGSRGRLPGHAR